MRRHLSTLVFAVSLLVPAVSLAGGLPKEARGAVTYVDFWASWCAPCAQSFPWLARMQAQYGRQGLKVVGVGVDSDQRQAERFLQKHPPGFFILPDPEGRLAEQYGVEGMPYAVILDAQGQILHRHTGYRPEHAAEYEQAIVAALATAGALP